MKEKNIIEQCKALDKPLEEKHWNECRQIAHYAEENKKLKELLRAAMEDLKENGCYNLCKTCGECRGEPPFCEGKYKWRHAAEAEELLKGDEMK